MPKLSDEVKTFIVTRLACYDTPTEVATAVKAEFGLTLDRGHVGAYDATRPKPACSKEWQDLFWATRKTYLDDVSTEPASRKAVRVKQLADMARKAKARGNAPLAAQLFEQIAKEMGEAYTNRRVIVPADPLKELAATLGMSPEELTIALELDANITTGATDGSVPGETSNG